VIEAVLNHFIHFVRLLQSTLSSPLLIYSPDRSLNIRPDSFFSILRFMTAGSPLDIQGLIAADSSFTVRLPRPDAMG
jgi:hypothetical protein